MNKIFKTLSVLTIASFAASLTACSENSTASDSDENEIIAKQELSDDEELAEISSSSKKSKATSSSEEDETLDSEEEFVDSEDENVVSSSSEKESTDEEKVASSSSEEKISSDSKKEKSGKFSGKVSGVSQKGPFILGSKVTLYEIEGESLNPSGNSFISKIKNDKGEFEVSYKDLSSNYAMFVVDGYYRNEVTGRKSVSPITLNALSDLTDRKTVNVNILTHLEFDRVKYLVGTKGVEYGKAKAQVEKEIFDAFGISFQEGSSAEDLSIVGTTENDAALLALSVVLQGTSAEAAFSERLARIAQDLEEDGAINDKQILADIADEVALMDLSKVRKNIEGWKLSSSVPNFENYVESYRTASYDIGACTKEDVAKTAKNTNKLSKNYEKMYVCEENGWREMTADESKYGTCAANEDGKRFEKSRICDGGKWRSLTADESMGACTEEKIGEIATEENELSENFGKKLVCDVSGWRLIGEMEEELGACTENKINSTAVYGGKPYACEAFVRCSEWGACSGWYLVDEFEYDSLTFVCSYDGEVIHSEGTSYYYVCRNGKLSALTFDDMSLDKDFTANVWNGATDSKIKVGEKEFEIYTWTPYAAAVGGTRPGIPDVYGENGDKFVVDEGMIKYPVYDKEGVSSALKDKGVKYRYEFENRGSGYEMIVPIFPVGYADISDWGGLCIVYASSMPFYAGFDVDGQGAGASAKIPAAKELSVANLKWDDFTLLNNQEDIMNVVKKVYSIEIAAANDYGHEVFTSGAVYIAGIGKYNGCSVK